MILDTRVDVSGLLHPTYASEMEGRQRRDICQCILHTCGSTSIEYILKQITQNFESMYPGHDT